MKYFALILDEGLPEAGSVNSTASVAVFLLMARDYQGPSREED